jgi:hypothetical protein
VAQWYRCSVSDPTPAPSSQTSLHPAVSAKTSAEPGATSKVASGSSSSSSSETPGVVLPKQKRLSWIRRLAFGICGFLLVTGFFLPWVVAGTALEFTGLGLVFARGDVVKAISGSGRFLLFLVPLLGVVLVVGSFAGQRWTPWAAALGAGALLIFGAAHVLFLFISSTGPGMWIVVLTALATLAFGALSVGGQSNAGPPAPIRDEDAD